MTDAAAPLTITHLAAGFGNHLVLEDVSLRLGRARIAVVLGGSGSGKTTLLRHAVGLLTPKRGEVALFGQVLSEATEDERSAIRRRIGVLFQSGALMSDLTVRDNVMLPMRMLAGWPRDLCRQVADTKLAWLGLGAAGDRWPNELSGGMRKRAALARALALEPELLFCDEPSAGLDPVTAAELDLLLLRTRDMFGTSMLVVTHELASIEALADDAIMLAKGRVLAAGTLAEVRSREEPLVQDFFLRRAHSFAGRAPPSQRSLLQALGIDR